MDNSRRNLGSARLYIIGSRKASCSVVEGLRSKASVLENATKHLLGSLYLARRATLQQPVAAQFNLDSLCVQNFHSFTKLINK